MKNAVLDPPQRGAKMPEEGESDCPWRVADVLGDGRRTANVHSRSPLRPPGRLIRAVAGAGDLEEADAHGQTRQQ